MSNNYPAEVRELDEEILARYGITAIANIPREKIDWAWKGRFAFGKYTDLSGEPGDGKSIMMTTLAAQITRGFALPYGSQVVREPRAVLYFSAEDDAADTIRPRLEAAGGDANLLHVQRMGGQDLVLPANADDLRRMISALNAGLVIIDPIFSYIGDLDSNSYSAAVSVCDRLTRIAAETHCILNTIRHLNKAAGAAARNRPGGSVAWGAKPRCTLSLGRDPQNRDTRVLTSLKGNLAKEPKSSTFTIIEPGGAEDVGRILWGGDSDLSADEVHGAEGALAQRTKTTKVEQAANWILARLAHAGDEWLLEADLVRDGKKKLEFTRGTVNDAIQKLVAAGKVEKAEGRVRLRDHA